MACRSWAPPGGVASAHGALDASGPAAAGAAVPLGSAVQPGRRHHRDRPVRPVHGQGHPGADPDRAVHRRQPRPGGAPAGQAGHAPRGRGHPDLRAGLRPGRRVPDLGDPAAGHPGPQPDRRPARPPEPPAGPLVAVPRARRPLQHLRPAPGPGRDPAEPARDRPARLHQPGVRGGVQQPHHPGVHRLLHGRHAEDPGRGGPPVPDVPPPPRQAGRRPGGRQGRRLHDRQHHHLAHRRGGVLHRLHHPRGAVRGPAGLPGRHLRPDPHDRRDPRGGPRRHRRPVHHRAVAHHRPGRRLLRRLPAARELPDRPPGPEDDGRAGRGRRAHLRPHRRHRPRPGRRPDGHPDRRRLQRPPQRTPRSPTSPPPARVRCAAVRRGGRRASSPSAPEAEVRGSEPRDRG